MYVLLIWSQFISIRLSKKDLFVKRGFFCAGVVISDQFESGGLEDLLHALQLGL